MKMGDKSRIYLDHNATTPLHPEVRERIIEVMDLFGNPSSMHEHGRQAKAVLDEARETLAEFIGALPEEILFTASGSEANNMVLHGATCGSLGCPTCGGKPVHMITSTIEHPSVYATVECLEKRGVLISRVAVDDKGMVDPEAVREAIRPETRLISIMHANNEIGTIEPVEEISVMAREKGIAFHMDAVQSLGKIPLDMRKTDCTYCTFSAHKINAPKGIGALYVRKGTFVCPLITGGHQEQNLRAGTENTIGIAAFGKAVQIHSAQMKAESDRLRFLRDRLQKGIMENLDEVYVNGHEENRLPGTLNVSFRYIEGESILLHLDLAGISVSTGSACSTGSLEPSHVLTALGMEIGMTHGSIRFSLGYGNTEEEIDRTISEIVRIVPMLRKMSPLTPE